MASDPLQDAALRAFIEGQVSAAVSKTGESIADMLVALANNAANEGGSSSFVRGIAFAAEAVREVVQAL